MFKIALTETYEHPVIIEIPGDKKRHEFTGTFRRFSQSQLNDMREQITNSSLDDAQFCREVLVGWKGVRDEDGAEIEFSNSNLDKLLDIYPVANSIVAAFYNSISGAKLKN